MGGHGGLNILPQKRWNVYNFDNREKVRLDEEAAAKEEQLKREQSRKRDTELRIEQLRQSRGLASTSHSRSDSSSRAVTPPEQVAKPEVAKQEGETEEKKSKHINLFEGIRIFDPVEIKKSEFGDEEKRNKPFKRMKKEVDKQKPVFSPEDETYRLGYGVVGKGVKLPWYVEKRLNDNADDNDKDDEDVETVTKTKSTSSKKRKSVEELREERLKREGREKERERALMMKQNGTRGALVQNDRERGYSTRSFIWKSYQTTGGN